MKLRKIISERLLQGEGEVMVSTDDGPIFPSWDEAREIAHRCNVHDELVAWCEAVASMGILRRDDEEGLRTAIAKARGEA